MKKQKILLLVLFLTPTLFSRHPCYSDPFNLEVKLNTLINHTGKSVTIEATGRKKWQKRIKKNQTVIINKKLIPSINICNGMPMQEIATIWVSNSVKARLWFALIEQGDKKYTIQAIITDPSGSRSLKYQDIIAVDTLRYYKPDMYNKLNLTINLNLIGKKVLVYGQSTTEIRAIGLEITPGMHAIIMKPATQRTKPAKK